MLPFLPLILSTTIGMVILGPLVTFGLLLLKGLPSFALAHMLAVLLWAFAVTWIPALGAGLLLSALLLGLRGRLGYFTKPYDFGRCFSLGAIAGAIVEALSTLVYRTLSHRPFSSFWIAGAAIAGCLAGAVVTAWVLRKLSPR